MQIKIAISSNFGGFYTPMGFHSDNTGTKWRMDLAQYLIDNATVSKVGGDYDESVGGVQKIVLNTGKVLEDNYYFMLTNEEKVSPSSLCKLTVVTVDTDEKWTINDYDGAESVEYLPVWEKQDEYGYYKQVFED